ncbi:MAG: hypothetical protein QW192_07380, partial [Candidatus Caldarchaeum sp.]
GLADSFASGFWDARGREIVLYGLFILILWVRPIDLTQWLRLKSGVIFFGRLAERFVCGGYAAC